MASLSFSMERSYRYAADDAGNAGSRLKRELRRLACGLSTDFVRQGTEAAVISHA